MDFEKHSSPQELETQIEKEFRNKLRANKNKTFAVNLVESLLKKLDSLVNFVATERKAKFDCKAGCSHCCTVLRVEVLVPEIFYIAAKLKKYPEAEKAEIIRRLETFSEKIKSLSHKERNSLVLPCVFLKDGACSIYEFRPFPCRRWHSLDVNACLTPGTRIPGNEELVVKAGALLRGFAKAYEKNKLPVVPSEFSQALLVALTDESALDRWMKGEEVFPRLPELDASRGAYIFSDRGQ